MMKKVTFVFSLCILLMLGGSLFAIDLQAFQAAKEALANNQPLTPAMKAAIEEVEEPVNRGHDELDRTGGPDAAGYEFADSDEPNGPTFEWLDLENSENATQITGWGDDTYGGPYDLGFDFEYYGETRTSVYGSANGLLGFNSTNMSRWTNYNTPDPGTPNDIIAIWWDDMHAGDVPSTVFYEQIVWEDGRNAFVWEINDLPHLGGRTPDYSVSFEAVLFDNGLILMQYDNIGNLLRHSSSTTGIENASGTVGLSYCYNNVANEPVNETAIYFGLAAAGPNLIGIATDIITGETMEGVAVDVYDADTDEFFGSDTTDSLGFYCVRELLPGTYYLTANIEGYVELLIDDIVAEEPTSLIPDPIEVDLGMQIFIEVTIGEIQTEVPDNTWVRTTGIVTLPTNTTDTEHSTFFIQDETGYGVLVYGTEPWDPELDLHRGDEVNVVGRKGEYEGITELADLYSFEVLSTGNPMPEQISMQTGSMAQMQEMEGSWAHIEGYLQDNPAGMGSYTIRADDGSGDCAVRIYESTGIDLVQWNEGDWLMFDGVIGIYEGDVQIIPSLEEDITRTPMDIPCYTRSALDDSTGVITFSWDHTAFGVIDQLTYDNGPPSSYYSWPDHTMGTRVSPAGECRVIALKYYIWAEEPGNFDAQIYRWNSDVEAPGAYQYLSVNVEVPEFQGWREVIISDDNINITGDFVVAFGSLDRNVELGVNTFFNERAWDFDGAAWAPWTDTYYIRAIIQYTDGTLAEIGNGGYPDNELDAWTDFCVYRDSVLVDTVQEATFTETLPGYGTYTYTVTAVYNEGETGFSGSQVIVWEEEGAVAASEFAGVPSEWAIASAYPNPFNPTVNVVVAVPLASRVRAEVFDLLGRTVAVIDPGQLQAGYHQLSWRADGPSGIYFMKVSSSTGWSDIRKVVYMK